MPPLPQPGIKAGTHWPGPPLDSLEPAFSAPRLVSRLTYGVTPAELALARSLGHNGYLEYHLNWQAIDDSAVENWVAAHCPRLAMSLYQINNSANTWPHWELISATLYRAVFSRRQLYQRMVEFWTDHFNISFGKSGSLKVVDDREVIRRHALDTFPNLLRASAHSVAMLEYLDNVASWKEDPNQNYPRELMELHTMGADGGYTQQDVIEVARCLTGWSRIWDGASPNDGTFTFYDWGHDYGAKTVLGQTIPAGGGQSDGETVLNILAAHPSTARFITRKMATWLLGAPPPPALHRRLVSTYLSTNGDIKALLRVIMAPKWEELAVQRFKRPFHYVASALRASGAAFGLSDGLNWRLYLVGQPPFEWPAPNGYPDNVDYWGSLPLPRWNFASHLALEWIENVDVSIPDLLSQPDVNAFVRVVDGRCHGGTMADNERAALRAFALPAFTDPNVWREGHLREALALALSFPGFQWY